MQMQGILVAIALAVTSLAAAAPNTNSAAAKQVREAKADYPDGWYLTRSNEIVAAKRDGGELATKRDGLEERCSYCCMDCQWCV
jgi:hypothetical protein